MAALSERLGRSPERAYVWAPTVLMLASVSVRSIGDPKGARTARFWRRPVWGTRIPLSLPVVALDAIVGAAACGIVAAGLDASPVGVAAAAILGALAADLIVAVVMRRQERKLATHPQS